MPKEHFSGKESFTPGMLAGLGRPACPDNTRVQPFPVRDPEEFKRSSPTYWMLRNAVCNQVSAENDGVPCNEFMEPYERNTKSYQYDEYDALYTPEFLDRSDCPVTPEDVEEQFQSIFTPYGIQYVRPKVKYTTAYESEKFNGTDAWNWTEREKNLGVVDDIVDYIVDNFIYEKDIPMTTNPLTDFTMHLDASRIPDLGVATHEYKHVVELPALQNLMYIYALNEFRKQDWARRVVRGKDVTKADLKLKLGNLLKSDLLKGLPVVLENLRNRLDFMENEDTLGQHCYNNIPLLKQLYDKYLPGIMNQ